MRKYHVLFVALTIGICGITCNSCSTCSRQQQSITVDVSDVSDDSTVIMAQKVFYALPTPIEMSLLVKNLGVHYQASLLNNPANTSKYVTNQQMALNFGVYVTDLVYAGLFEQTPTMLRYKISIQQMIDGLGMSAAVDTKLLQELEHSMNNRDKMLAILSDTYASCSAFLTEDDRHFLSVAALVGGWVEGMYIATSLTNEQLVSEEQQIEQIVIDQKLTFDIIWQEMNKYKDHADIADLMQQMGGLAQAFDEVQIDQSQNTIAFDKKDSADVITSVVISSADANVFAELKKQIQTLRHNFVK